MVVTIAASLNVMYEGQLEFLRDRNHRLTLVTGGEEEEINRLRDRHVGDVVRMPFVRQPHPIIDLKSLFLLIVYFFKHRHDMVVVTTPKAILLGALAAFITRQSRIVVFFQGRVYENFSGFRRWFYKSLDQLAAWCAHEVVFVSSSLMEVYEKDGKIFGSKGVVVGRGSVNGVCGAKFDPELFQRRDIEDIKADLNVKDDDFIVVVIGRICHDKGLEELDALTLRAQEAGAPFVFVFVGWIEDGVQREFGHVQERSNVRYVGATRHVEKYLAIADVHLFLTHREGFGNVAVEAAAMGVPTIAFDVVGVKDSVNNGVSGVRIAFGDMDGVWSALWKMTCVTDKGRSQYGGARAWALQTFGRDVVWERYEQFYKG